MHDHLLIIDRTFHFLHHVGSDFGQRSRPVNNQTHVGGAVTDTEVKAHLHLKNPVNAWHNMCLKPLQVGSTGPRAVTQGDSVGREAKKIDILTCLKLISTAPVTVRSPRDSSNNNDGG
jgi:hypothetical protein